VKADIEQIGDDGLDLESELSVTWVNDALGQVVGYHAAKPGLLSVHLTRADDVVVVQGSATMPLQASCARCLKVVDVHLHTPLEVTMVPRQSAPGPDEQGQLSEDDVGIGTYEDGEIDVGAVVRDEMLLELPMRALCQSDCKGLCAQCGLNQNDSPCSCAPTTGDMRLAGLAQIKLKKLA
jgi:uncharacterized protein